MSPAGSPAWNRVAWSAAIATIGLQISYPLVHGGTRDRLTVTIVLVFAAASLAHAAGTGGLAFAGAVLLVSAGPGLLAELIGEHTGHPFGHYRYAAGLGPHLGGVPIVIALAWTMFAWPAAIVARQLGSGYRSRVAIGAWALAAWDVFLDPQMVAAGYWRWSFPRPHLPGVNAVPLTNYAGWLLVATVISLLLQGVLHFRLRPGPAEPDRPGAAVALFAWTYLSSILALGAFLGRPAAAGWGALLLGPVALPVLGRAAANGLRTRRAVALGRP